MSIFFAGGGGSGLPTSGGTMTGPITFPAGTVGAPAITFTGDTTTGFYWPFAGAVVFADSGVAKFVMGPNIGLLTGSYMMGGTVAGGGDTFLNRVSAGTFGLGTATNNTSGNLQLNQITNYNGTATAGQGVPSIVGATVQKSETGADTNVLTVTPPAAIGLYRIRSTFDVSAASGATFGWTISYKDSNGTVQTPTNIGLHGGLGTSGYFITGTVAAGSVYYGDVSIAIDNSATPIVVKTTFSGTSIAYKASAYIERIA